jgi:hypothetical protein
MQEQTSQPLASGPNVEDTAPVTTENPVVNINAGYEQDNEQLGSLVSNVSAIQPDLSEAKDEAAADTSAQVDTIEEAKDTELNDIPMNPQTAGEFIEPTTDRPYQAFEDQTLAKPAAD